MLLRRALGFRVPQSSHLRDVLPDDQRVSHTDVDQASATPILAPTQAPTTWRRKAAIYRNPAALKRRQSFNYDVVTQAQPLDFERLDVLAEKKP